MNIKYSFVKFLKWMILAMVLSFSVSAFAKEISLYDQPKSDAKTIGAIDLSSGIIPIYTPKEGGWVKIADPKNGNVGWAKSSDLNNAGTSQSIFTFTQSIGDKTPTTYRIIQFGNPTNLSTEQTKTLVKEMQTAQQEMQKSMQNMMRDMDQLFNNDRFFMHHEIFPFVVPVMIMPVQKSASPSHVNKSTSSTLTAIVSNQNSADNKNKK